MRIIHNVDVKCSWVIGRAFVLMEEGVIEYFFRFEVSDLPEYKGKQMIRSFCGGLRPQELCRPLDYVCNPKYLKDIRNSIMNTKLLTELVSSISSIQEPNYKDELTNFCGESLRHLFFSDKGFGCYDNFELREGVRSLPEHYNEEDEETWTRAEIDGIFMEYHWDGDGTLTFIVPTIGTFMNDDCKKPHNWNFFAYTNVKELLT
jgi:hypothetical protein